ncbi:galactose-3-O-sulfotransferase 4 isoform X2 [Lampris incognitus]|uniref:galactose-3-O-sulfotransferase 4 isoform X2 n=2 Tax=Lampris incognitus TaxID=2546036 RepID=UPI0024B52445|nr:galactose-3-O-sulfotransferase 4 isoform X2 [Lampris incognitus]
MLFRRRTRRMRWLGCYRLGPLWLWKALLVFVAIAFAGQLLGVIFNKSVQPAARSLFSSSDAQELSLGSCQPRTHVMFLKTHKTASSTVLNMLYRYGEERDLHFALPLGYQLGYPLPFNAHRVKGYRGPRAVEFHIMANHMRFNKPEVEKVMPANTLYFSIIRDPVALAESSFAYYKEVAPAFRKAKGLGDFADDPKKYYDPHLRNNHYARNLLWFDFGMDHNANFSTGLARHGVAMIRQAFKLILVSEYFDQSMVLLRHALCWPLDAVVSFSLNARQQKPSSFGGLGRSWVGKAAVAAAGVGVRGGRGAKEPPNLSLTDEQREKLRDWNALDWYLYKAFNQTFWEEVNRFGHAQMDEEVALLRTRREVLARVCLRDGGKPVEAHRIRDKAIRPFQSGLVKILGYELQPGLDNATRQACLRMIRPEIQYKDLLDAKQFPRAQPRQGQPGEKSPGPVMAAAGAYGRQDTARTGERLSVGERGGTGGQKAAEEEERDWDGSRLARRNQTLLRGEVKGRLR